MLDQTTLNGFIGTESYTSMAPLFPFVVLTEGVRYVAENGGTNGAFWLVDAIASYQPDLMRHKECRYMQFWELKVNDDKSADLVCRADSGQPAVVSQHIEYTDFDLDSIKIWAAPNDFGERGVKMVLLLPSEY